MRRLKPEDFKGRDIVTKSPIAVLFYAGWCPFCTAFRPKFEDTVPKGFELAEADLSDGSNPLWEDFGVRVVPTLIAFKNGKAIWRRDGRYLRGLKNKDLEAMMGAFQS